MKPAESIISKTNLSFGLRLLAITALAALFIFACSAPTSGGGGGDTTAPTLSDTNPTNGSLNVDNNSTTTLILTFSENVTIGTGNIEIRETSGGALFDSIPPASISGGGTKTIVVALNKTLRESTEYYVLIPATLFADAASNAYTGISNPATWTFTTMADTAAPTLSSTGPAAGATDVPSSLPSLSLTFNEDVHVGTGNIVIYDSLGTTIATMTAGSLTGDGTKTVTAPFSQTLTGGTSYYVNIDATLFSDYAATPNYYAGISDTTTWTFTAVADTQAPTLVSVTPADGSSVDLGLSELTMTFDEAVNLTAGNVTIYRADTSTFATIAAGSLSVNGTVVTIPVGTAFEEGTDYYVNVDSGLIQDKASNPYSGISDNSTWNFTIIADTEAPTLSSTTPADNATGVAASLSTLTMVFSENVAVNGSGGNIVIYNSNDTVFDTILPASVNAVGNTVTATFTNTMLEGRTYYVTVPADLIHDLAAAQNYFAGFSDNSTWNFTILADTTAPAVVTLTPADNQTAVPLSTSSLTIVFDDNVVIGTGDITIYNEGGSVFETIPAANLTGGGTDTITVPFAGSLTASTPSYYVTIPNTLFSDSAYTPNFYAGFSDSTTWNFTARPKVPTITGLDSADDSAGAGGTTSDGITNHTTNLTILGTADPNVGVNLSVGGSLEGSTTSNGSGDWSYDIDRTEGVYSITATATVTGYESAASSPYTLTVDTTGPTVTVEQAAGQNDPTNASPINFTVTFNENVYDFVGTDVTIGGTAGGTKTVTVTGGPKVFNAAVSGMTDGTVVASLASGVAHDIAGNASGASTSSDNSVTGDFTGPTPSVTSTAPATTHVSPIPFSVDFGETVTGFAQGDISVPNGTVSNFTNVGGLSQQFTFDVTPTGTYNVTVTVTIAAGVCTDALGNGNTLASLTRTYSTIVYSDSDYSEGTGSSVTVSSFDPGTDSGRRGLLVFVTGRINASFTIASVTYGTSPLTLVTGTDQLRTQGANNFLVAWYYLADADFPAVASDITASFSRSLTWSKIAVYRLDNVSQAATPYGTVSGTTAGSGTSDTLTLNSLSDGSWTIDGALGTTAGNVSSAGTGQTNLIQMSTTVPAGTSTKPILDGVTSTDMVLNFDVSMGIIVHAAFELFIEP